MWSYVAEVTLNKIPSSQIHYNTRNADQVETYNCRTDSFFPYTIIEWKVMNLKFGGNKFCNGTVCKLHTISYHVRKFVSNTH